MMKSLLTLLLSSLFLVLSAQLYRDQVQVMLDQQYLDDIQFADLDQDGDLDFIGNRFGYNGSYLAFFNQDGNGNFSTPVPFGDTTWWGLPDLAINFVLNDMDNDGDPDLVPGNIAAGTNPFWPNDGSGNFATDGQVSFGNNVQDDHFFRIADLDNDGLKDIVILRSNTRELYLNKNQGLGQDFAYTLLYDAFNDFNSEYISDFLVFDYDQDGDLDFGFLSYEIFYGEFDSENIYFTLYEQTCSLCFEQKSRTIIDEDLKDIVKGNVTTTDLDNDSYPDLLINYEKSDDPGDYREYLRILRNEDGTGAFHLAFQQNDILGITTGDFDLDDDEDLFLAIDPDSVSTSGGHARYFWAENLGNFSFQTYHIDDLYSGEQLLVQDLDQDNQLDLITLRGPYTGSVFLRRGNPDLSFSSPELLNTATTTITKIATEDWDDDGDLDLLFCGDVSPSGAHFDGIYRQTQAADGTFGAPELVYQLMKNGFAKEFVDLNNDGKLDAIGIEDIFGLNTNRKLIYTLQQADGSWSEGIQTGLDLPALPDQMVIRDWDYDGDQDVLTKNHNDDYYLLRNDLASTGEFTSSFLPDLVLSLTPNSTQSHWAADVNADGYLDLIAQTGNVLQWAAGTAQPLDFLAWDTVPIPLNERLLEVFPTDWNNDGYVDILFKIRTPSSAVKIGVSLFDPVNPYFGAPIFLADNGNVTAQGTVVDLNQDGYPDYFSVLGYRINQLNGLLLSAPYLPEPIVSYSIFPSIPGAFTHNANLATLMPNEAPKLLTGIREILAYPIDFLSTSTLSGFVRWDTTAQCQTDSILPPLENWNLSLTNDQRDLLTSTNANGQYGSVLPDTGTYLLRVLPPSGYWAACPADTLLQVADQQSAYQVDFSAEALVDCPLVVIDINSTTVSQCFGSTVSIGYHNVGTALANEVEITLLHDPRLLPVSSNLPWSMATDSTLTFSIGEVAIGEQGFVSIQLEPLCEELILGEEICFEASITPNELCDEMLLNWDGANLEADVLCQNDTTAYLISNTGEGATAMPVSYQLSIVNDDIILYLDGTVILGPGESDTIPLPPGDNIWYLQFNQTTGHPYPAPVGLFTNNCSAGDSPHLPELLPTGTGDPFRVVLCREVVGPYDPNDKAALPIGLTEAHYIQREWPLDYTIQFQNVGSDRARNVILEDTLSPYLDLSTFTPLSASHPYEWLISDDRVLRVIFLDINLPDSTSNEVGSHGFFSFRIKPQPDTPFETDLLNFADIFFDFNAPIRTGTTQHRIRKPQRSASIFEELCAGEEYLGQMITTDTILRETLVFSDYDSTTFYHLSVLANSITTVGIELAEPGMWEGIVIQQDTLIQQVFLAENGCDSIVNYELSILTNTNELAAELQLQLHPNPAADATQISWRGGQQLKQVQLINSIGQVVQVLKPSGATKSFQLPVRLLNSGSYQLLLFFEEGQVRRRLQVVH
ncbi:T9SS type A sorting domain-containing protein [Lewinella sp. LCG006]|uniref:T9SS type A sorting domain-containing protein n=1 Tax=Lewinella sp. LCG006 TaxID=3231911 RepID=UPI00345FDD55